MIVIAGIPVGAFVGLLLGALWGGLKAWRRKGKAADIAQYAAAHGIALGIIGLFISIVLTRLMA